MELQPAIEILNQALRKSFKGMTEELQQCTSECLECHRACEQAIPYCLQEGGDQADRNHIQVLSTCADICRTSAHFMMWNSILHSKVCGLCTEVCLKCAQECEHFLNDEVMRECAAICRKCAASCEKMSTQH
ncbi:MAG: four-helix bundle copper-binding protein [Pseudobdellovibrionaceae bacterium]